MILASAALASAPAMFPKVTKVDGKPQAVASGNPSRFRHVPGRRGRRWLKELVVGMDCSSMNCKDEEAMLTARRAVPSRRHRTWPVVLAISALVAGFGRLALLEAQQPASPLAGRPIGPVAPVAAKTQAGAKPPRIREGTALVEQAGVFQKAGDRITFFASEGQRRFVVLENLQLERVSRAIGDNPTPPQWTVSGMVTEFCGANYLLVNRAVLRSTAPSGSSGTTPRTASLPSSPSVPGELRRP